MLGQRVVTAVVLLALLVPALLADSALPFAALTLLLLAAAGWEWGRLNQLPTTVSLALGAAVAAACVVALRSGLAEHTPAPLWWAAAVLWLIGGPLALRAGPSGWPGVPRALRTVLGLLLLWAAWLAISQARHVGVHFVLSVFCIVWMADIAAYFGGRAFGRHKLAPSISPGKSWEGAWSGLAGVILMALVWLWAEERLGAASPSLHAVLRAALGLPGLVAALVLLVGMSVVGDLFESLVKRAAGAKDSSRLLPGHGGVLDRIDALLPVFPIAMALASLR